MESVATEVIKVPATTPTPARARAYYRMAGAAHASGDHTLGNHWADRAREVEREAAINQWHDDHVCPDH